MDRKVRKKKKKFQIVLLLQFIAGIIFIGIVKLINILPAVYFIAVTALVLLIFMLSFFTQFRKDKSSSVRKISTYFSIVLTVVFIIGSIFIFKGYDTLSKITSHDSMTQTISVIVMNTSSAKRIGNVKDETFAVRDIIDLENTNYAIEKINEKLHSTINTRKYIDFNTQINDLYNGVTNVMILNETYRVLIKEKYPDFDERTKIIYTVERKVPIENTSADASVKKVFNIYISGIDTYGSIDEQGRSDVNIVATVNPETKEILLTNIPRDYYVRLYGNEEKYDKLTHAGMYGTDCSIKTVEDLLQTEINYYVKVNFSSMIDIINAIGGIEVNSQYSFDVSPYHFIEGMQHMNGEKALAFARDRYHLPNGDNDRGKNQQAVITAIINKLTSPAVIVKYSDVLTAVAGSFQTNMSSNEITSLVQMQLTEMESWQITSISLVGHDAYETTYTCGSEVLYVMKPDEDSLNETIKAIAEFFNAEQTDESNSNK